MLHELQDCLGELNNNEGRSTAVAQLGSTRQSESETPSLFWNDHGVGDGVKSRALSAGKSSPIHPQDRTL
jgi:hypothetical protein